MAIELTYYTIEEVAEILRRSPHTVRGWVFRKEIKHLKGSPTVIPESALRNFIDENTVLPRTSKAQKLQRKIVQSLTKRQRKTTDRTLGQRDHKEEGRGA